jgi:hypothetical protein
MNIKGGDCLAWKPAGTGRVRGEGDVVYEYDELHTHV